MAITLDGTNGITAQAIDLVTPLPQIDGGTGASAKIVQGTVVASTSGTSITFTGIPSWAKRITVMFNAVSTSGTANYVIQVGSGSITTTGYVGGAGVVAAGGASGGSYTNGYNIQLGVAAALMSGLMTINLISGTTYVANFSGGSNTTNFALVGGGTVTLGSVLDRVNITTSNGTDTFDAGSINIMYE